MPSRSLERCEAGRGSKRGTRSACPPTRREGPPYILLLNLNILTPTCQPHTRPPVVQPSCPGPCLNMRRPTQPDPPSDRWPSDMSRLHTTNSRITKPNTKFDRRHVHSQSQNTSALDAEIERRQREHGDLDTLHPPRRQSSRLAQIARSSALRPASGARTKVSRKHVLRSSKYPEHSKSQLHLAWATTVPNNKKTIQAVVDICTPIAIKLRGSHLIIRSLPHQSRPQSRSARSASRALAAERSLSPHITIEIRRIDEWCTAHVFVNGTGKPNSAI